MLNLYFFYMYMVSRLTILQSVTIKGTDPWKRLFLFFLAANLFLGVEP